jgi:Nif-specific regulatory protein
MENKIDRIIEIAALLNHQVDWNEMLRLISTKTKTLFDCDIVKISVFNPATQNSIKTAIKSEKDFNPSLQNLVDINISGWMIRNKKTFISNNLLNDPRFPSNMIENSGIKSAVSTLLFTNNQPIGILILLNKKSGKKFTEADVDTLETLTSVISPFIYKLEKIQQYFNCPIPDDELINKYQKFGLIGKSPQFINMLKSIESAAKCDVRILLEGATGTGKELVAKVIHKVSSRAEEKFIVVDCSAISENLIESELFGHAKGSFTGATKDRKGIIEEAEGGTIFIDEINHLPQNMQFKFLRFLQEKEFRPVGSNKVKKTNVRIITASSRPLDQLVKENKMQEELLYRLNVYPIHIPTLNDRMQDIMPLAHHFIKIFALQQNKMVETLDSEITEYLIHKTWNGNVRELENFIERIVTLTPTNDKIILKENLPLEYIEEMKNLKNQKIVTSNKLSLTDRISEIETQLIIEALVQNNWNQTKAAHSLNLTEQTLRYKINKLHIYKPE